MSLDEKNIEESIDSSVTSDLPAEGVKDSVATKSGQSDSESANVAAEASTEEVSDDKVAADASENSGSDGTESSDAAAVAESDGDTPAKKADANEETASAKRGRRRRKADSEESAEEGERSGKSKRRPRRAKSNKDLNFSQQLTEGLERSQGKDKLTRLHTCLAGTVQVYISGSKERFYLDGSHPEIEVKEGVIADPDCAVTVSAENLQGVIDGVLNPQIALLSDKIEVRGQAALAIYVFNLFQL